MAVTADHEVLGQPSWRMDNGTVELYVTKRGAHMAPVCFTGAMGEEIAPYYISPWQGEGRDLTGWWSEIPLRGDFFCMPFGSGTYEAKRESHPSHGETSGAEWSLEGSGQAGRAQWLEISLETKARSGHVQRKYWLVEKEQVVYDCTTILGFAGAVTMAHHAVLRPPTGNGKLILSSSRIRFGKVYPLPFGNPAAGDYQGLQAGAEFEALERVPSIFKDVPDIDCSMWPELQGFTDLLQVAAEDPQDGKPSWVAAVNATEGYIWFALKNAAVLPSTIFWRENRGRHGAPWLGRNCALGIEDACTYFDCGIEVSAAPNVFSRRGIRTHHDLSGDPFEVRYIQGVISCAQTFGKVVRAEFTAREMRLHDAVGQVAVAAVQHGFLFGDKLT
jgi:hypothetical protein